MKNVLLFISGFVAGIIATIFVGIVINASNQPNEGLPGLTVFPEKGECITTTSKNKSCEITIFQVLAPNAALGNISCYSDKRIYGNETYRDYDIGNDVVVLLINYDDKTYYDDQKIDISNKCARQIGTYQYETTNNFGKTVPAVVIE
jgi:hypothetical protein